jgi:lysine-N-methylase
MCARYPRVMNIVDDVLERSLDLSCPEAARLVLLDPSPLAFDDLEGPQKDGRFERLPLLETKENAGKPYQFFREIRGFVIALLQHRDYPLWKRLVILGSLCDELHAMAATGRYSQTPEILEAFRDAVQRNLFDEALGHHSAQPVAQLELILELIVGRISSDFTSPRFLACYQEFMQGLQWTAESSMDDIGRRYTAAFEELYTPFLSRHEHMLEHYLVSYVHRTLFPLGAQESNRELSEHHASDSIRDQCLRMTVHYGIIQTVLIGLAGFHKEKLTPAQVIQVIQSFTKAFEHSLTFPKRTLEILAEKGVNTCAGLAILIRN